MFRKFMSRKKGTLFLYDKTRGLSEGIREALPMSRIDMGVPYHFILCIPCENPTKMLRIFVGFCK